MISQATYKRESRRLSIAENRFKKAAAAVRAVPNLYSAELEGKGLELARDLEEAAALLETVAAYGLQVFELQGYPDAWHRWQRLGEDASRARARISRELETLELEGS